jgi:CRISPR-associated endonuclease/helicase Cas3
VTATIDFAAWYAAARDRPPLPWMTRLAAELADGRWPEVLALPTGAAKTEIVAIWAWALATTAPGSVPRRLWLASDRRVIADQAARVAGQLADRLADAQAPAAVQAVAGALRALSGRTLPLRAGLLRGGIAIDDEELLDPLTPLAVAATVDQLGSRLLWRAYGAGPREWPLWAGLVGEDSLLVLDEAHLSAAAEATIRRARQLGAGLRIISMTATPRPGSAPIFALDAADRADPILRRRLEAQRMVVLQKATDVTEAMAAAAETALTDGARRVAVVCNTVRRAREVHARLAAGREDVFLVIGRSRPLDREALMARLEPRVASGAAPGEPLLVVATQCLEAGADFDFDALVSEACPLDALRQRLGRLDRLGIAGESRCVLVAPSRLEEVPPYGAATAAAWAWLEQAAGKARRIDLGITGWERLAATSPPPAEASTTQPPVVTFLEPHLRLLTRTWPRPAVEPEVDLLLHGLGRRGGDVSIVWRADIDVRQPDVSTEILTLLPPTALEAVQVPVWEACRWLAGRSLAWDAGDVEGAAAPKEERNGRSTEPVALRWLGVEEGVEPVRPGELRAGDILVVPTERGGCDAWGWAPEATAAVPDLGDLAWSRKLGRPVRRVGLGAGQEHEELRAQEAGPDRRLWSWTGGLVVEALPPGRRRREDHDLEVTLAAHTDHVVAEARAHAQRLGLAAEDLALAARWHDRGKAHLPWQILIKGGDLARLGEPPLAKGRRLDPRTAAQVRRLARLPVGWRHEAESLRRLEASGDLAQAQDADLVRWLVATHHGYARPWWPAVDGLAPDPGLAELMTRLGRRLGWWRLGWLELVFRCADRVASRKEAQDDA